MNEWKFSGEIVRLKEIENSKKFKANITIKGFVKNPNDIDCIPVEFSCMIPSKVFSRKIKLYKKIEAFGHHESWTHETINGNIKTSLSRIMDGFTI